MTNALHTTQYLTRPLRSKAEARADLIEALARRPDERLPRMLRDLDEELLK